MKKTDYEKGQEIELEEMNIILKVPVGTACIKMQCSLLDDDGELMEVSTVINSKRVHEARRDFLENVEGGDDYDAVYT